MISEMQSKKHVHDSFRYLHLVGNEWVRASLDDPNLSHRLLSVAKQAQLPQRDRLILLIACLYGVRIREILRLTIDDWRVRERRLELRVHRLVSRESVKMLSLCPNTESLLRAYIHGERKDPDPEHRELSQLAETDPLFLTANGYGAFFPQWEGPVPGGLNLVATAWFAPLVCDLYAAADRLTHTCYRRTTGSQSSFDQVHGMAES